MLRKIVTLPISLLLPLVLTPSTIADPPSDFEVPLIVQELLPRYGESPGPRTQELVTMGIPLAEDSGITFSGQLGLRGATAAKFTPLARWESGGLKWVLVDFLADVPSGGENRSYALTAGEGGFGGEHLATETSERITVDTGPAEFVVRKNSFNLFDRVVVDGQELVSPGHEGGIVAYDANAHPFSSRFDPAARVDIEINGPVRTVIAIRGRHTDDGGQSFLDYTLRLEFVKGQRTVSCTYTVRNASYHSARHERSRGIELSLPLNLGPEKNFTFGTHTGVPARGRIQGSAEAYYYQAANDAPQIGATDALWVAPLPRTNDGYADTGYRILKGDKVLVQETDSEAYPDPPYADLSDTSGRGVSFGIRFLPHLWPGALECSGDGEIKVGIFTPRTGHHYTWNFGAHETRQFYLDFHSRVESNHNARIRGRALAFQYPIKARPQDIAYFNRCGVLSDKLISVEDENRVYQLAGLPHEKRPRNIRFASLRYYDAGQGGGGNQFDKSYHQIFEWMRTGLGGYYLDAELTAQYRSDWATFHSDDWVANYVNDPRFPPAVGAANEGEFPTTRKYIFDNQHCHNRHQPIFYYLTGDLRYRDSFLDNMEGRVFSPKTKIESLRTSGTRIFARTSWLLMEAYRFARDIDAVRNFAFNRDYSPPLTKEEIYRTANEYLQWGMDLRYFRDGSGWSDEPLQSDNDRRRFWAGGKNRHLYEEVIFHVANLFPDALYNYHYLSPKNNPILETIEKRMVDLNRFIWSQNIVGHCEHDAVRRGNYYRYFTFDRGTGAVPPVYPGCGEPTADSGSYDNHPCFQLFNAAHQFTRDPVYLHRLRNFLEGQIYNGGTGRNGERTDYQSALVSLLRSYEETVAPSKPNRLRVVHTSDHHIELAWDAPDPDPEGDCVHKYILTRNGELVDAWTRKGFLDRHLNDNSTYTYQVQAVDSWSLPGPAATLEVRTPPDTEPPRIEKVMFTDRADRVVVVFSEAVESNSASQKNNYSIRGPHPVEILSASVNRKNPHRVTLTTSPHDFAETYTLEVRNVIDRGSNRLAVSGVESANYQSLFYAEDFNDGVADGFYPVDGEWVVSNGYYERRGGDWKARSLLRNRPFGDFTLEVDVCVPDRARSEWAGVTLRTKSLYTWPHGGYLVFLTNQGTVAIHNERDPGNHGTQSAIPVENPVAWRTVRITAVGSEVHVAVNGVPTVSWNDPNRTYVGDWINLHSIAPVARFDNLRIGPPDFELDAETLIGPQPESEPAPRPVATQSPARRPSLPRARK